MVLVRHDVVRIEQDNSVTLTVLTIDGEQKLGAVRVVGCTGIKSR